MGKETENRIRVKCKKENLNEWFLSLCCDPPLLLVHCGSVGAFSHSAPFIRSPCFFFSSTAAPYPAPSSMHTQTRRHTPCWYQSKQSQWKSIIVLCHGNVPSCWDGVGWVCASRANIITLRFPHVESLSVQRSRLKKLSLRSVLAWFRICKKSGKNA